MPGPMVGFVAAPVVVATGAPVAVAAFAPVAVALRFIVQLVATPALLVAHFTGFTS
jgi:hypothetical protein